MFKNPSIGSQSAHSLETLGYTGRWKGEIMPYTTNPAMPRLRARAVEMVRSGKSVSEVAKYFGYTKGAVSKWCKKCPTNGTWAIPTGFSRPKSHPKAVEQTIVDRIKEL